MNEESWYPRDTKYNIYNQPDWKIPRDPTKTNDYPLV